MTVEQFEKFIQKSQFEMAMQLMDKEEFMLWAEKKYDWFESIRDLAL